MPALSWLRRFPRRLPKLFTIFYSTSFTFIFIALVGLLIITPADLIDQALYGRAGKQTRNIFVIAGCYTLTLILAVVIYINRLYTTRQLMEDIPKRFVPIKKGDLPGRVRRRIAEGLSKGAVLAWQSRPKARGPGGGPATVMEGATQAANIARDREAGKARQKKAQQPLKPHPIWGEINHPGWSPPDSHDLPNVEYCTVIAELPYLIEEKALFVAAQRDSPAPELVSRKPCMSLARYISYLTTLGYVDPRVGELFVAQYEKCRFWHAEVEGVSEQQFRLLMKIFAALLRVMDGGVFDGVESLDDNDQGSYQERGLEGGAGGMTMIGGINEGDRYSMGSSSSTTGSEGVSFGTFGSVIARPPIPDQSNAYQHHQQYHPDGSGGGYNYDPARYAEYDTESEYTDRGEWLSRRQTASSREEDVRGSMGGVWSLPDGLRRVITHSTTRSESSQDGSVRRTIGSWIGVGGPNGGGGGSGRAERRQSNDDALEMRFLSSSSRTRIPGVVRQRTSQGTFG